LHYHHHQHQYKVPQCQKKLVMVLIHICLVQSILIIMIMNTLSKKIALITGSTDGIGLHTAKRLANANYKVLIHGRSSERLLNAKTLITQEIPTAEVDIFEYDFINLQSSKDLANQIRSKYDRLDVLINNAGVFQDDYIVTNDKLESTFAINCCATFILNLMLLPLLKQTNQSRILNISSISQEDIQEIDLDNLQFQRGKFSSYDSYSLSKV